MARRKERFSAVSSETARPLLDRARAPLVLAPIGEPTKRDRRGRSLSRQDAGEQKGKQMKVAVTAQGKELSSEIDSRFGRARWLIVVDTETDDFHVQDNKVNLNAAQGAGIQTARNIADLGVDAVITGNMGPNAFKTLNAAGIKVFLAQNQTAQEAIDSLKTGNLKELDQANVEGHWV